MPLGTPVFKTGAFNRSATYPNDFILSNTVAKCNNTFDFGASYRIRTDFKSLEGSALSQEKERLM
jgi:hypothetical protein